MRRVAAVADGWLTPAYHTTPASFATTRTRLADELRAGGQVQGDFPNAVATFFFHITQRRAVADDLVTGVLAPALNQAFEVLADRPARARQGRMARCPVTLVKPSGAP